MQSSTLWVGNSTTKVDLTEEILQILCCERTSAKLLNGWNEWDMFPNLAILTHVAKMRVHSRHLSLVLWVHYVSVPDDQFFALFCTNENRNYPLHTQVTIYKILDAEKRKGKALFNFPPRNRNQMHARLARLFRREKPTMKCYKLSRW